jgi:hypothetical protein
MSAYFMKEPSLFELGIKHQTDKSHIHLFTPLYEGYFQAFRHKHIKLLEVGILRGESLRMWAEYFSDVSLHAVDINDYSWMNTDKIHTYIVNQEDEKELLSLPTDFDIIIDDGGHTMLQQQVTLKVLFLNHLKAGGIFILEDLHTSEPNYWGSHGGNETNTTLKLLIDLKEGKISKTNSYFISENDFSELLNEIESIEIIKIKEGSITSKIVKKNKNAK